jgi:hypothetical protein
MTRETTTKWERFAIQDLSSDELYRFYERSGIYQFSGGMEREDADKRAYLEIVHRNE